MKLLFLGNFGVDYSSENHHKKSLEAIGHTVVPLQEGQATTADVLRASQDVDALIWVHTHGWNTIETEGISIGTMFADLKARGIETLTYHLDLWFGLDRQKDLEADPFYRNIGHFFTVDKLMADWFNENTDVKGHYLHAAVFDQECYMAPRLDQWPDETNVVFVGSRGYHHEWPYRPQLIDWLKETYGPAFTHVGGDGMVPTTRGAALNQLYANSKVAIGDSLCINFEYPYYWSDRVYETLGRGGFIIHPYIEGMETDFVDGKHLVFYKFGDFDDLKKKIDYYLENDAEREAIRAAGHQHVKDFHTYKNRWTTIIETIKEQTNA